MNWLKASGHPSTPLSPQNTVGVMLIFIIKKPHSVPLEIIYPHLKTTHSIAPVEIIHWTPEDTLIWAWTSQDPLSLSSSLPHSLSSSWIPLYVRAFLVIYIELISLASLLKSPAHSLLDAVLVEGVQEDQAQQTWSGRRLHICVGSVQDACTQSISKSCRL